MIPAEIKETLEGALTDIQEGYRISGYSQADMDRINAALAWLNDPQPDPDLVAEIALLRDAFFKAVPASRDDHRFGEMIGSPYSVTHFVRQHLESQEPAGLESPDKPGEWWFKGTGQYEPGSPIHAIRGRMLVVDENGCLYALGKNVGDVNLVLKVTCMQGRWWPDVAPWELADDNQ